MRYFVHALNFLKQEIIKGSVNVSMQVYRHFIVIKLLTLHVMVISCVPM